MQSAIGHLYWLADWLPRAPALAVDAPLGFKPFVFSVLIEPAVMSTGLVDPMYQIHSVSNYLNIVSFFSLAVIFSAVILVYYSQKSTNLRCINFGILAGICGAVCLSGSLLFRVVADGWDETYLFASQIQNMRQLDGNTVWTTGPISFQEASTDVFDIWIGGLIGIVFPFLTSPTLVVLAAFIGIATLSFFAFWRLNSSGLPFVISLGMVLTLVLLQPFVLFSASNGFPLGWTALAFLLLLVTSSRQFHYHRDGLLLGLASLFAVCVRPELEILAGGLTVLWGCGSVYVIRRSRRSGPLIGSQIAILFWVPVALLCGALPLLTRLATGRAPFPTSVVGKSAGFHSDYFDSGIAYLGSVEGSVHGLTFLIFALGITVALGCHWRVVVGCATAATFATLTATAGGGDWFPAEWSRYIWPCAVAIVIVGFLNRRTGGLVRRRNARLIAVLTITVVLVSSSAGLRDLKASLGPHTPSRATCLAQAGISLRELTSLTVGVGTPELNTIAYFAGQPVTDLIGLADWRVATEPLAPLGPGDGLHRRHSSTIIRTDAPGFLYLYGNKFEGADCSGGAVAQAATPNDVARLGYEILDTPIAQYRVGDTAYVKTHYSPMLVRSTQSVATLFFVRNDLVPNIVQTNEDNNMSVMVAP